MAKLYPISTAHNHDEIYAKIGESGVSDHGALSGLDDNDHPQYFLANHMTDGDGLNYSITTHVASDQCYITILTADGSVPSSANFCTFRVGKSVLKLTAQTQWFIGGADYFKWNTRGIGGNDAQLFVYAIDNNGTLCFGVSSSPNLTVVGSYRTDLGTGIGAAPGFSNMVANAFSFAAGSVCRVIGRINVKQGTGNTWVAPTVAKVVSNPIFETDVMPFTFTTPTPPTPSAITLKYAIKRDRCSVFGNSEGVSVTGSGTVMTMYLPVISAMTKVNVSASVYSGSWDVALSYIINQSSRGRLDLSKTSSGGSWVGDETNVYINFAAEYPINE